MQKYLPSEIEVKLGLIAIGAKYDKRSTEVDAASEQLSPLNGIGAQGTQCSHLRAKSSCSTAITPPWWFCHQLTCVLGHSFHPAALHPTRFATVLYSELLSNYPTDLLTPVRATDLGASAKLSDRIYFVHHAPSLAKR